jgi:uncharacterized protein (DUF952 family)
MNTDLIYCPVSKRKWKDFNIEGYYRPKIDDVEVSSIKCATNETLNELLNESFRGRKNLFILVIDKSRLEPKLSVNKESKIVEIEGAINTDAVLDKIRINCNEDGLFDLEIESI